MFAFLTREILIRSCCLFLPSFFLEKNMFAFFLNILRQKSGRYVCVQLLQTLNILFENISHETSLCKRSALSCPECTLSCFGGFLPPPHPTSQVVFLSVICISADYLLSNNHVNSIIVHKFDFSDEEIMAYYISFLKTLSLKLNNHTVHFFYNEVRLWDGPEKGSCDSKASKTVKQKSNNNNRNI